MQKNTKTILRHKGWILLIIGGIAYVLIELLWRRRSHWSMFLVGGICFGWIGKIYTAFAQKKLWIRCALSALVVTTVEFVSGCILNLQLGLSVWNYSQMPLNIGGQVCLLYSFFWSILSIPAAALYKLCLGFLTDGHMSFKIHSSHLGERAVHTSLPNKTKR